MPVYNAAATIDRAARSILDGDWQDLELIIVDDGSDEPVVEPRARVIRTPHRGIVSALNAGIAEARAPVIARMDADDYAHPTRLTQQMPMLDEADIVGCAVNIVGPRRQAVESMRRYERWINENLDAERIAAMRFVESPLVHPTVLAKREVFELGYREGPFPEDYDLWLRAMAAGFKVVKAADRLLDWTEDATRLTRTDARYSPEAFDRCRREHLLAGPLANVEAVDLWGAGQTGKPWLRWLIDASRTVRRAIDIDPRKIGKRIHGVMVEHPDDLPAADGTPIVIAVGAEGARPLIEPHVLDRGYVLGRDAWFVA